MSADAARLSRELRQGSGPFMAQRRGAVAASLVSIGSLGVIALYQMGVIPHVPEPPLLGFDADKVNGSAQAYAMLSIPDGILGIGSYAATMALAAMGGPDRAEQRPWIPLALAAKAAFDAAQAAKLSVDQMTNYRAYCSWCILTTAATATTAALVIPEALAALRQLRHRKARGMSP